MTRPIVPSIVLVSALVAAVLVAGCASPGGSPSTESPSPNPAGASHDPAPADFPLLGSWTTTITRDDLRAGGLTEEGLLKENSGVFTWALETDGTWRMVMVSLDGSPVMHPVFSGYYTVEAGEINAVTEFPEIYRDEGIRYSYELSGDAVSFGVLNPPDHIWPIVLETHPWTRTGS